MVDATQNFTLELAYNRKLSLSDHVPILSTDECRSMISHGLPAMWIRSIWVFFANFKNDFHYIMRDMSFYGENSSVQRKPRIHL